MIKKIFCIISTFLISINLLGQTESNLDVENKLIEHFKKYNWTKHHVSRNSLYKTTFNDENFNISISNEPADFDTKHIVIKNPYFSEKYEELEEKDYRKYYFRNYPISFSVMYNNHIISLFENGKFACYDIKSFERNTDFEKQLNSRKFETHWIIDKKLVAQSRNQKFVWDEKKWTKLNNNTPLKNQPKLYDDSEFIVFRDCHGEWGGTIYFYEKSTGKTFFTESTCANTVIKTNEGYQILAHLGHMMGSSEIKIIPDPRKLTQAQPNEINKTKNGDALGYTDKSNAFTNKLDLYGIQIFSTFHHNNEEIYVVNNNEVKLTFLAKIKNNEIEIVHPLFFYNLYTHHPITTQYGEYTIINLDFYGIGFDREVSILIIHKNQITKIDWNEKHDR